MVCRRPRARRESSGFLPAKRPSSHSWLVDVRAVLDQQLALPDGRSRLTFCGP